MKSQVIIVLGVSGAGKTTVGRALAQALKCELIEGDDFHSDANKNKMHTGHALTDEDRWPWLQALARKIGEVLARQGTAVVSCSALKRSYRDVLRREGVCFVYLKISREVGRERLARRDAHFFDPSLLDSQFETLEEPRRALTIDAGEGDVSSTVNEILERLDECPGSRPREYSSPACYLHEMDDKSSSES